MNEKITKAKVRLVEGRVNWAWVVDDCPFCHKQHHHGGGALAGDPRRLLGHRVGHCEKSQPGGYVLVEE